MKTLRVLSILLAVCIAAASCASGSPAEDGHANAHTAEAEDEPRTAPPDIADAAESASTAADAAPTAFAQMHTTADGHGDIERVRVYLGQIECEWNIFVRAFDSGGYSFAGYVYVDVVSPGDGGPYGFSIDAPLAAGSVPFSGEIDFGNAILHGGAANTPLVRFADTVVISNLRINTSEMSAPLVERAEQALFDNIRVSNSVLHNSIFAGFADVVDLRNICISYTLLIGTEYLGGLVDTCRELNVYNLSIESAVLYTAFWSSFRTAAALFAIEAAHARLHNVCIANVSVMGFSFASAGFVRCDILAATDVRLQNVLVSAPSTSPGTRATALTESAQETTLDNVVYADVITSAP